MEPKEAEAIKQMLDRAKDCNLDVEVVFTALTLVSTGVPIATACYIAERDWDLLNGGVDINIDD